MALTINWDMVSSITRNYHIPKLKDQYFHSNPLFYRLKDRVKKHAGGPVIVQPLSFAPEGGGGTWWSGTDRFDTTVRNPIKAANYFWKNAVVPCAIDLEEELQASGPEAVLNLVEAKMKIAENTLRDLVGTNLFNSGANAKAITGLQFAIPDNIVSTSQTYGGILCGGAAVGADANGWWQPNSNATAYTCGTGQTFMQATDNPMSAMWGTIALRGGREPSLILSNWGAWTDFHNSMAKNERYDRPQQNTDLAKAGFRNLMYRTAPWVADSRAPRDSNDVEKVYLLDESSIHLFTDPRLDFHEEGWRKPVDQAMRVMYLMHRMEVGFDERRTSGVLSNVDTTNVLD